MTDPLPADLTIVSELLRRAASDEAPPATALARAIALRPETSRLVRRAAEVLRQVVALAVPDAGVAVFAPAFGVRGGAAPGKQWLFKAEECEIDLRVTPTGDRWTVAGQVLGSLVATHVELSGAHHASVAIESTCEFVFVGVPSGPYRLAIRSDDVEIVVPMFEVGDPSPA